MTHKFKVALLAMAVGLTAAAQPVVYKLKGADTADADAVALLRENLTVASKGDVEIIIGEAGDKVVKKYLGNIPETAESFYLSVSAKKVIIAGRDETGTFYGVQEFLKNSTHEGEIAESPAMSLRGVIEGFYGNPWSNADRKSQFDFYGKNRMNIYIYGPKDDPYHHARWFEPYPDDKAAEMAELIKHAAKNKVKFVWAMHPSNSIETAADRQKALNKFQQMYDLGVREFAIFFDDISAKSVEAQISYMNFLDSEFVKKHSDVGPLIVCPTIYNRAWSGGDYLNKMGAGLAEDIKIMWTGNSVCDMIDAEDCRWFTEQTGRKPFIWLNYPVNDYGMHNLLMGPVVGNDPAIADMVSAFCSNPMQYAEASKVALYSLADFAWDPTGFNADEAWENSLQELMPDNVEAFKIFCLNNVDVAPSVHGLRFWGETPEFKALNEKYGTNFNAESINAYRQYFNTRLDAAEKLLASADAGQQMLVEVREWIVALKLQAQQGLEICNMAEALASGNNADFIAAYSRNKTLTEQAGENISRNFPGSIQSVRVQTGTLHVAPWIKTTVNDLADAFKKTGAEYPADLFPVQVVENGTYYIKHNGRILGNPQAGSKGGFPVWQDAIDDINPNRQEWHIKYDPNTERYEIRNSKDERYINELGNFGVNPYSADWNTYIITRNEDGKYSIQNAGNGGSSFWNATDERIVPAGGEAQFVFDIIPIE